MDSELVNSPESRTASPLLTYTERFERLFPFYLSIGMTYEQYWDGDPMLVKAYRKAYEIKREVDNETLWLQGMYIYEALCCVAPILHAFSRVKKPLPYRSFPYPVKSEISKARVERQQRTSDEKAKNSMEMFMVQFNKKFAEKGG